MFAVIIYTVTEATDTAATATGATDTGATATGATATGATSTGAAATTGYVYRGGGLSSQDMLSLGVCMMGKFAQGVSQDIIVFLHLLSMTHG